MSWVETSSPSFTARHTEADADDVVGVLELLEGTRERLAGVLPVVPEGLGVVVHPTLAQLDLAQPVVPLLRRLTAPASRRYLAGWFTPRELHVLAPRLLEARASNVPGSREMLLLTPAALYAQLAAGLSNPALPPPLRVARISRYGRFAWLAAGAGQWFSGQTAARASGDRAAPARGRRAIVPARHPRRPAARRVRPGPACARGG